MVAFVQVSLLGLEALPQFGAYLRKAFRTPAGAFVVGFSIRQVRSADKIASIGSISCYSCPCPQGRSPCAGEEHAEQGMARLVACRGVGGGVGVTCEWRHGTWHGAEVRAGVLSPWELPVAHLATSRATRRKRAAH